MAVEESCQLLLHNCASDCWTIVSLTVEELCRWLLNNRAGESSTSKYPRNNVCSEILFDSDLCLTETGQLICTVNELTNSYIVRAFIERYFRKTLWSVHEYLSVKRVLIIRKPINWFAIQILWVFAERHFCTDYDWRHFLAWIFFTVSTCYMVNWKKLP